MKIERIEVFPVRLPTKAVLTLPRGPSRTIAEGKRIVIINEAHHAPRHRAFTHRLMLALREAGFTHFAAETFTPRMPSLLEDGAPMVRTGPYIRDPVFADLVRQAAKAGSRI